MILERLIAQLITYGILFGLGLLIIVVCVGVMSWLGDTDRAANSGLQALRWLAAGGVIAAIADAFASGSTYKIILPFSIAFAVLAVCEYTIRHQEAKIEAAE